MLTTNMGNVEEAQPCAAATHMRPTSEHRVLQTLRASAVNKQQTKHLATTLAWHTLWTW
jgi:hypothetical protein